MHNPGCALHSPRSSGESQHVPYTNESCYNYINLSEMGGADVQIADWNRSDLNNLARHLLKNIRHNMPNAIL